MSRIFTVFQQAGGLYHMNHWKAVNIRGAPKLKKLKHISALPNIRCDCFYTVLLPSVKLYYETRMYSSGMRTARLLTVSQHALRRGVCILSCTGQGGVSQHALDRGCVCPEGVSARGFSPHGGVCLGGCLAGGFVCPGGVADTSQTRGRYPP